MAFAEDKPPKRFNMADIRTASSQRVLRQPELALVTGRASKKAFSLVMKPFFFSFLNRSGLA